MPTKSERLQRIETGSCFDQHLRMIIIAKSESQCPSQMRTLYIGNLRFTRWQCISWALFHPGGSVSVQLTLIDLPPLLVFIIYRRRELGNGKAFPPAFEPLHLTASLLIIPDEQVQKTVGKENSGGHHQNHHFCCH